MNFCQDVTWLRFIPPMLIMSYSGYSFYRIYSFYSLYSSYSP